MPKTNASGGGKPKLNDSVPSIGTGGNPSGVGSGKSVGLQYPFLPSSHEGSKGMGSGKGETGSTDHSNLYPFLPNKPE